MRRSHLYRVLGLVVASLTVLAVGFRPSLKAQQPVAAMAPAFVGGAFGGGTDEAKIPPVYLPAPPMTVAETKTRLKLHEKLAMNFPNGTPLEDVLKYIEQATIDKTDFPDGLAVYLDPTGLQDADKTSASTISINLKGMPLETTLDLMLKQLGLTYWINKDGLIIITATSEELVTPQSLDLEILSNLSSLRSEVKALKAELQAVRRGGFPDDHEANRTPNSAPAGGMGSKCGMM